MEVEEPGHDPKKCYSCIAKKALEKELRLKFNHVIVVTTDHEGFHSAITGLPSDLTMEQKTQLVENFIMLLNVHVHRVPIDMLPGYRSIK